MPKEWKNRAPVIFIGHGSPMNALETNSFTQSLANLRNLYPFPKAILCISAHWMTEGTWVTHMEHPKTIHDFYGFPQALFNIQYPAPGNPELAELICASIAAPKVHADDEMWGLDHGTWSVLRHMFPEADVPIVQLSLNMSQSADYHFQLGIKLRELRNQGILIIGSGNIVHNLRKIRWEPDAEAFDWAVEFDEWIKSHLEKKDFQPILHDFLSFEAGKLSVPTMDHYYPLLYILGASDEHDELKFAFEGIQNGSIAMRTFSFGPKA